MKLKPKIQRTRTFCGHLLGTTGLPVTHAAEVFALREAPREKIIQWLSGPFLKILPKCVFLIPDNAPIPHSVDALDPIEGDCLDLETLESLCLWIMGLDPAPGESVPLPHTAGETHAAPSPSLNSSASAPTP